MTRKDIQNKYNIIGNNNDICLFRKSGEFTYGIGYCGNISLVKGNIIFNGKKYKDVDSLDEALIAWEKSLPFPVDSYCPMYKESYRVEARVISYLTEKLGFNRKFVNGGWDTAYVKSIGPSFDLSFHLDKSKNDDCLTIFSKYGEYAFRQDIKTAEDGIACISAIVNASVLQMATDIVSVLSVCDTKVTSDVDMFVESKKNILGFEKVNFKDFMIKNLENQLKALKES